VNKPLGLGSGADVRAEGANVLGSLRTARPRRRTRASDCVAVVDAAGSANAAAAAAAAH